MVCVCGCVHVHTPVSCVYARLQYIKHEVWDGDNLQSCVATLKQTLCKKRKLFPGKTEDTIYGTLGAHVWRAHIRCSFGDSHLRHARVFVSHAFIW